jgi:hypothetical protein
MFRYTYTTPFTSIFNNTVGVGTSGGMGALCQDSVKPRQRVLRGVVERGRSGLVDDACPTCQRRCSDASPPTSTAT